MTVKASKKLMRKSKKRGYDKHKAMALARSRDISASGREVGPIRPVEKRARRKKGGASLLRFCETYMAGRFYLKWSSEHKAIIAKVEKTIRHGGLFAFATPRGFGKTSLVEAGGIWAICYGLHKYIAAIAATRGKAQAILESIKTELQTNDLLNEDFPEICQPIRALENVTQRSRGQLLDGRPTNMSWQADRLVLPTVAGSAASGAIIQTAGLTSGEIRGLKFTVAGDDGKPVVRRPTIIMVDDPQTDKSARSATQCETRMRLLNGAILGMAGPGENVSAFVLGTVIYRGDLTDELVDGDLHPHWQGERKSMVAKFPKNEKLWNKYAEIRAASLRAAGDGKEATKFYRKNRKAMDAGAVVAWRERHNPDELSALQHAMNLMYRDRRAFFAEYQNKPESEEAGDRSLMTAQQIAAKVNGIAHNLVPLRCDKLTAHIDVHERLLYYTVAAWGSDFTGAVISYGTYPEQPEKYFAAGDARRTLRRAHRGAGVDGAIYAGLEALTSKLLGREWRRDDGTVMRIQWCLIDQGWKTETVHQFCRASQFAATLMPSRGRGIGASSKPISDYARNRGDKIGYHWMIPSTAKKRVLRHVEIDVNFWKSFIHERFDTAMADIGCLALYGKKGTDHKLFSEHMRSEYRVRTIGQGRTVDEWKLSPSRPDNHWFDCLVGCACAASMRGVSLPSAGEAPAVAGGMRKRISLLEIQKRKKGLK